MRACTHARTRTHPRIHVYAHARMDGQVDEKLPKEAKGGTELVGDLTLSRTVRYIHTCTRMRARSEAHVRMSTSVHAHITARTFRHRVQRSRSGSY